MTKLDVLEDEVDEMIVRGFALLCSSISLSHSGSTASILSRAERFAAWLLNEDEEQEG